MRFSFLLFVTLISVCIAQSGLAFDSNSPGEKVYLSAVPPAGQAAPVVEVAWIKGKKLIVIGSNFADGAEIFVNGEKQKTRNDPATPTNKLIAKKAGNHVSPDAIARLQIHNPDGQVSEEILFYTGRTMTRYNFKFPTRLRVGERFLVDFRGDGRHWQVSGNSVNLGHVVTSIEHPFIEGAQGLYQAAQIGRAKLLVDGAYPCTPPPSGPPCPPGAIIRWELVLDVE